MKNLVLLLRPHQWLKNGFIFLPLFFDRHLGDVDYWWPCIVAFVAYCLAASGIYCFNDILDAKSDRMHPKKCKRPVACGDVSPRSAYGIAGICVILSLLLSYFGVGGGVISIFLISFASISY